LAETLEHEEKKKAREEEGPIKAELFGGNGTWNFPSSRASPLGHTRRPGQHELKLSVALEKRRREARPGVEPNVSNTTSCSSRAWPRNFGPYQTHPQSPSSSVANGGPPLVAESPLTLTALLIALLHRARLPPKNLFLEIEKAANWERCGQAFTCP